MYKRQRLQLDGHRYITIYIQPFYENIISGQYFFYTQLKEMTFNEVGPLCCHYPTVGVGLCINDAGMCQQCGYMD